MRAETPAPLSGRWLGVGLALSIAATALLLRAAGETIAWTMASALPYGTGAFVAALIRWTYRDPVTEAQRIARDAAEYVGLFSLVCLLGAVASYPEAAESRGFVDPALERIDAALHFDWVGWYGVVAAHPLLQIAGRIAYESIYVTPALLFGHYAVTGRRAEGRRFLAGFWLAAVSTLILFPAIPAVGPLAYLWHGPIPYMPASALFQIQMIPELRAHALTTIDPGALRGLVAAPSFHTTSAVLYIAAGWKAGRLRLPILLLNIAMLLSTPVEGTHYLADMIGGALVGLAALAAVAFASESAGPARDLAGPARAQ